MPELLGEEETGLTVIDRLNELLEAERAGVDTPSRLCPEARGPEMQKLFEEVKVMQEPTLVARLRFLNRGQAWLVQRLDGLLGETLPSSARGFLEEMKARHLTNIEACERLAESLQAA